MSVPLILQGIQARVTALEATGRRCDHGDRLDVLERDLININNSIDVLRMGMGGRDSVLAQQNGMDNVVVAALRGAVDGLSKREFTRAAQLQNLQTQMQALATTVAALEEGARAAVQYVQPRAHVRAQAENPACGCKAAIPDLQARLSAEVSSLRAAIEAISKTAMEHARAGHADIDALKHELEHLKLRAE